MVTILVDAGLQSKQPLFPFWVDGRRFLQEVFYSFQQDIGSDILKEISIVPNYPIRWLVAEIIIIDTAIASSEGGLVDDEISFLIGYVRIFRHLLGTS